MHDGKQKSTAARPAHARAAMDCVCLLESFLAQLCSRTEAQVRLRRRRCRRCIGDSYGTQSPIDSVGIERANASHDGAERRRASHDKQSRQREIGVHRFRYHGLGRQSSLTMDVLVPGYGVYPIDRREIQPEAACSFPVHLSCLKVLSYSHLVGYGGLFRLLGAVGARLKELVVCQERVLDYEDQEFPIEACAILRACPKLESLHLETVHVPDIGQLSRYYETHDCQLSALEFSKHKLDPEDQLSSFFRAMGRTSSRMAQKLRGIRVDLCKAVVSMDVLLSIQEMLKNNRGLKVLVMNVPHTYRKLFQRGVDIVPHALCLPMRSKVALVSVVTAPIASSQAISRLDTGILSTIIAFAAPPQQRVVRFITDYLVAGW